MYELLDLPIPSNSLLNVAIGDYVTKLIDTQGRDQDAMTRLDMILYHLYDLTYDEVLVVDPETPITREKYESFKLEDCDK